MSCQLSVCHQLSGAGAGGQIREQEGARPLNEQQKGPPLEGQATLPQEVAGVVPAAGSQHELEHEL